METEDILNHISYFVNDDKTLNIINIIKISTNETMCLMLDTIATLCENNSHNVSVFEESSNFW